MKPVLIDIMLGGVYKGQLKYTKRGFPEIINGEVHEVYDADDIRKFVEEMRPSLKGKPYTISFSNQRV